MCNFLYLASIVVVLLKIVQEGCAENVDQNIREGRSPGGRANLNTGKTAACTIFFCKNKATNKGGTAAAAAPTQTQAAAIAPSSANQYDWLTCPAGMRSPTNNNDFIAAYPNECHYYYTCRYTGVNRYEKIVTMCPANYYFSKDYKCEPAANANACYGVGQQPVAPAYGSSPPASQTGALPPSQSLLDLASADLSSYLSQIPTASKKMSEVDIAVSTEKASWKTAKLSCEKNDLILLVIESQEDNDFINKFNRLRQPPFRPAKEGFWSGARFKSTAYTSLFWDPTKQPIFNFLDGQSNTIVKSWAPGEPFDDSEKGNDVCVEMQFPGDVPPLWSASDCETAKYFVCVRPSLLRDQSNPQAVISAAKVETIPYDKAGENVPQIVELTRNYVAVSKGKLSWVDALNKCEKYGLRLMVLDVQQDINFFNDAKFLREKPYDASTKFWSAGKMLQTDSESMSLYWEPMHRVFANYADDRANMIEKKWDGVTASTTEEDMPLCIDVQFSSSGPARWSATDCLEKRHYICTRTPQERTPERAAINTLPAIISDDREDD